MGERRALVIGARNDRFGRLDFVDQVARELHRALMDELFGACRPALPGNRDLLLGEAADCDGIKEALTASFLSAATDQATLFVYFIGHGHREDQDFYLIASDTPGPEQVDSDTAIPIGQRVKEALRHNATIDGLMLVLDACHSGSAITDPVPGLLRTGISARMEVLAATRENETASNGCFTRSITGLLTRGSAATANAYLLAYNEHGRLRETAPSECQGMPPAVHVSLGGGPDAGLWLGRNHIADVRPALANTSAAAEVARLTRNFVPTNNLDKLMGLRWSLRSPIAVKGGAGTGKSTLLAALGRTSIAGLGGVDALATIRPGDTLATVAATLGDQLQASSSYRLALQRWIERTPASERNAASASDRILVGPLVNLAAGEAVVVALDGVDLLATLDRRRLLEALSNRPGVVLVAAGREITEIDDAASVMLPDRDPEAVMRLLADLTSDEGLRDRLAQVCAGDWLLARILAGLWGEENASRPSVADLDAVLEKSANWARTMAPAAPVEPVLAGLAAVPAGASMPLALFALAVGESEEPRKDLAFIRDALVALGEMVARADPGTVDESVGPAHDLIGNFLAARLSDEQLTQAHLRMAHAAATLQESAAPARTTAYIRQYLSDHLWLAGKTVEALAAVPRLDTPADNLALWQLWEKRLASAEPDSANLIDVRSLVATWTGQAGDARAALEQFSTLLHDAVRVHAPDHTKYAVRGNIALWTGRTGNPASALDQFNELLRDQVTTLGKDDPDVFKTRANIVTWTGESGNEREALNLATQLLADEQPVLGSDNMVTLNTRAMVVNWTGRLGDVREAIELARQLLADQQRLLGGDHTDTLVTRSIITILTAQSGDLQQALSSAAQLLRDQERVLGADHPDVLTTRSNIAVWTGMSGDVNEALGATRELLRERQRVLGPDHPATLQARGNLAIWTARAGNPQEALNMFEEVLQDQERILGSDHTDTFDTRGNIALWIGETGNNQEAVDHLNALLDDQRRVLGDDHPRTKMTIENLRTIAVRRR